MKISIFNRFSASVIFEHTVENNTLKLTLELALKSGADLYGANLRGANLRGANLRGADLRDADLRDANLYSADLYGANLYDADLYDADLRGADLRDADLRDADLRDADLYGANLRGANLRGADLRGADLYSADLYGANLRGEILTKTPLQLNNLKWFVLISDSYLRIGCQRHLIADWEKFKDSEIEKMDSGALNFWKKWKNSILALCKAHSENEEG